MCVLYTTVNVLSCASVVAIMEGRNSVCIVNDEEEEDHLLNKLDVGKKNIDQYYHRT